MTFATHNCNINVQNNLNSTITRAIIIIIVIIIVVVVVVVVVVVGCCCCCYYHHYYDHGNFQESCSFLNN